MYRQQNHLIESEKSIVTNVILLYKALGGGWEVPQDTIPLPPVKE